MNSSIASSIFVTECYIANEVLRSFQKFPSRVAFASHIVACSTSVLIMLATVTLNSLTFLTFWWSPRLRNSTSFFLIMILSCVDTVCGLVANMSFTLRLASEIIGTVECWIHLLQLKTTIAMTNLSLITVSAIHIERYLGVVHPLFHRTKLQKGKLLNFLILSWTVCAIMLGLSFYDSQILRTFGTIITLSFVFFTGFTYSSIAKKIITSQRQFKVEQKDDSQSNIQRGKEKTRLLRELKLAKSCFIIVICYVFCFTPAPVFLEAMREKLSDSNQIIAIAWCVNLLMLNSSLNSLIFFWRSKHLRRELKCVLKRLNQCNNKIM